MVTDKTSRDYEVCACRHTTRGQIEDFVRETRTDNLKEVCEKLNTGNKCGGCREMIEEIINTTLASL